MRISALRDRTNKVKVYLPDELGDMTVSYKPTTSEIQTTFEQHQAKVDNEEWNIIDRMAHDLASVITAWDITDEDGNMIPPSVETLLAIDGQILNAISKAITEHMFPPTKAKGTSAAG